MSADLQGRLLDAVSRCLAPIVRLLMGAGVNYTQFDELAKRAFLEQAFGDPEERGRATNISRAAVRTGLSRKEVARLKAALDDPPARRSTFEIGRPARALQLWHSDPDFLDEAGDPVDLPFDEGEPSFVKLVKRVGGDVPAGAVRAELLSAGGMIELPNGRLRVQKRFFVPSAYGEDFIVGLAFIVAPLLETMRHNLENPDQPFIQRIAYSDHLPDSEMGTFREISHVQAAQLMQRVDEWLAEHEEDSSESEDVDKRVGLGVFYFENKRGRQAK